MMNVGIFTVIFVAAVAATHVLGMLAIVAVLYRLTAEIRSAKDWHNRQVQEVIAPEINRFRASMLEQLEALNKNGERIEDTVRGCSRMASLAVADQVRDLKVEIAFLTRIARHVLANDDEDLARTIKDFDDHRETAANAELEMIRQEKATRR